MTQVTFVRRMIGRELRRERGTFVTALIPVIIGVSIVVSLGSLRTAALDALNAQGRELAGADISLRMRGKPTPDYRALQASIPGEQVTEVRFPSMLQTPSASRLVQVHGYSAAFPFYGAPRTEPPGRWAAYQDGQSVLIDQALALQLALKPGDQIRLGSSDFSVAAIITQTSGETEFRMSIAPRVIVLEAALEKAGLLGHGIRQETITHYKLLQGQDPEKIAARFSEQAGGFGARLETPTSRRVALGETVNQVYQFLGLIALATLVVGALGAVSGGAHFAAKKQRDVALFRCLGASVYSLLAVYAGSFVVAALIFSVIGALFSIPILWLLGNSLSGLLPVPLPAQLQPDPLYVVLGIALGTAAPLLFALPPIVNLRLIAPLSALRTQITRSATRRGRVLGTLTGLVAVFIGGGSLLGERSILLLSFSAGLMALVVLLAAMAWIVRRSASLLRGTVARSFALRHGLASLGRPGSEALFISILVGLPLFLGLSLWVAGSTLSRELDGLLAENDENLVMFDIQPDQRSTVEAVSAEHGVTIKRWYPLVSMRIAAVKGVPVATLLKHAKTSRERWQLSRQYRNTYRSGLIAHEQLLAGKMVPRIEPDTTPVPISIEQRMADRLEVGLNDTMVFNVQGLMLETVVTGLRRFDFRGVNPGFFVVFPEGVLEAAPQFKVATASVGDLNQLADFQRSLLKQASNVSLVDSRTIRETLHKIFAQLAATVQIFVILFLAAAASVIVATICLSSGRRLHDFRIYRYLGAGQGTLRRMAITEFFAIGLIGTGAGAVAALIFSVLVALFYFKVQLQISLVAFVVIPLCSAVGVALLGLAGFRLAHQKQ